MQDTEDIVVTSIKFALENSFAKCSHILDLYNYLAKCNILLLCTEQGISSTYDLLANIPTQSRDDILNFIYILYDRLDSLEYPFQNVITRLDKFITNLNVVQELKDIFKVSQPDIKNDFLIICTFILRIYIDIFDKLILTTYQKE